MRFFAGKTANEAMIHPPAWTTLMPHSNQTSTRSVNRGVHTALSVITI
jgi:hypothetical protein